MAIKMKSADQIAAKFASSAAQKSQEYAEGVANASPSDYEQKTQQAAPLWAQGVQAAVANKSFEKGVQGSGAKWQRNAQAKGASNYVTGVSNAAGDYAEAFAPYVQTLQSLTLPPRGVKGDPKNIERVRAVADALRKRKLGK